MSRTCRTHGENKNEYVVLEEETEDKWPLECPKSRSMRKVRIITLK